MVVLSMWEFVFDSPRKCSSTRVYWPMAFRKSAQYVCISRRFMCSIAYQSAHQHGKKCTLHEKWQQHQQFSSLYRWHMQCICVSYLIGERDRERERMRKVNVSICIISFRSAFMCSCVLSGVATKSWTLSALFVQSMRLCIHATMCRVYLQFNFSLFVLLYFKRSVPRFSPFFGFMNTSKYLHAQYGQIGFFSFFLCSLILFYVYDHHPQELSHAKQIDVYLK